MQSQSSLIWNPTAGKPQYSCPVIPNRRHRHNHMLTSWWLANEMAGSRLMNICHPHAPAVLYTGNPVRATGVQGAMVYGNGSDTDYRCAYQKACGLPPPYSVMLHVIPTNLHDHGNILWITYGVSSYIGLITFANGDWHWQLTSQADLAAGSGSLVNNRLSMLTITNDGQYGVSDGSGTCTIYQDGIVKASATRYGNNTDPSILLSLLCDHTWGRYFTGYLISAQFWNRCLSPIEVIEIGQNVYGTPDNPRLLPRGLALILALSLATPGGSNWFPFFLRFLSDN